MRNYEYSEKSFLTRFFRGDKVGDYSYIKGARILIDLMKKGVAYAFAIISVAFTFIPEAILGKVILISENILKEFKCLEQNILEFNIIVNRMLSFVILWFVVAVGYKVYLLFRNKVSIRGNNYIITVEYGDLLKKKKCKRVIDFDECFSTYVGNVPADIKSTLICGQYLI